MIGFFNAVSPSVWIQFIGTLLGTFLGAYLAGKVTLKATEKQITFLKQSQKEEKMEEEKQTLLIIKSYLKRALEKTQELIENDLIIQSFGPNYEKIVQSIEDDINNTKMFIRSNVYKIDPNIMEKLLDLIGCIEDIFNFGHSLMFDDEFDSKGIENSISKYRSIRKSLDL